MNYPDVFKSVDSKLKLASHLNPEDSTQSAPVHENNDSIQRLKSYMQSEEPFLNPALSINELASSVELPAKELSILINQNIGQHFFDFINAYRIEKAKHILTDISKKQVTVLEILYEVGFNSKSSFNTAFKKHTGTTPTLYRKKNILVS
ncbi:hypothetical protein GCM10022393_09220 [Aquimarina addita]|uniref:HTH araC/xylS-type domain-containing protein n=1 Tax=Aquimarina addita TaxID=870485 RepID=A0ABP7XD26_9FLAO